MKSTKSYFILFLVISIILVLVFYFRTFLMINIIEPIAILFWAIWRIVISVNQNIYWIISIVVCLFLVVRLIPSGNDTSLAPAYNYEHKPPSRVEYWQSLLKNAAHGKAEAENLRDALKKLLYSVINQTDQSYPTNLEQRDSLEQTSLPSAAHNYLFPPEKKHQIHPLLLPSQWFRVLVGDFYRKDISSISEALQWMESFMEINRE